MNNQEIIDKVPEGSFKSVLIQSNAITWGPTDYRSLADIKRIVELEALVFQSYIEGYSDALDGESKLADAWKSSSTIDDLRELKEPNP